MGVPPVQGGLEMNRPRRMLHLMGLTVKKYAINMSDPTPPSCALLRAFPPYKVILIPTRSSGMAVSWHADRNCSLIVGLSAFAENMKNSENIS